ncbi:Ca2+/H+ antiporter [Actinomycetales bacterium JB111]|nr:Ca2+/H+ antiporter [Actinomycetales bacterium JB111]
MAATTRILNGAAITRLAVGWGAFVLTLLLGRFLEPPVPAPLLVATLVALIAVILGCAFGVVHEAEHLARRLGDPYGTLVLTLSIVAVEVILISAVMLGPGEHATIARDSVTAVAMIILCLIPGIAYLVGGRKAGLRINPTGGSAYLAMLLVLMAIAFALAPTVGSDGGFTSSQAWIVAVGTLAAYAYFLYRQTGAQAADFREIGEERSTANDAGAVVREDGGFRAVLATHRREIIGRGVLLIATAVPIVLLSHEMAALLDDGMGRLGAPPALAGLLIACIVFLPESITAVRAAAAGEGQRVLNLCHGALVSTVGLTIPAVLVIGELTGQHVLLAESAANGVLLAAALGLTAVTFAARRIGPIHGLAHVALFGAYLLAVLA